MLHLKWQEEGEGGGVHTFFENLGYISKHLGVRKAA